MKRYNTYIWTLLLLLLLASCANQGIEEGMQQPLPADRNYTLSFAIQPMQDSHYSTRLGSTESSEEENKIESLQLYYFSLADRQYFYMQEIKVDASGSYGFKDANGQDIPVAEGVFTAAQKNGKYAQFIVIAVANHLNPIPPSNFVDDNSYYRGFSVDEAVPGAKYKELHETAKIDVMKATGISKRAAFNGEALPMVGEGRYSLLGGVPTTINSEEYNRLGQLELKRVAVKIAVRVVSQTNASFTVNGVQFLKAVQGVSYFETSGALHNVADLLDTEWVDTTADLQQSITSNSVNNDDYVFYINENFLNSVTECPLELRTYINVRVATGSTETEYIVLANNSSSVSNDAHYLKRNKVYLTTIKIP